MKLYRIHIDGVKSLPQDFLLQYCKSNDVGIYVDVNDDWGFLYTKASIQVYLGKDKVSKIRAQVTEEIDARELLR